MPDLVGSRQRRSEVLLGVYQPNGLGGNSRQFKFVGRLGHSEGCSETKT